jgi:hypothetical protein
LGNWEKEEEVNKRGVGRDQERLDEDTGKEMYEEGKKIIK